VEVVVNAAGLAPGFYRGGLRFRSTANKQPLQVEDFVPVEGFSQELTVEVLVPGRSLEAAQVEGSTARVGAPVPLDVTVTAYDCDVDQGRLWPLNDEGKRSGPVVVIDDKTPKKEVPDPQAPELVRRVTCTVPVTPRRAGRNAFLVVWPRFLEGNGKEGPSAAGAPKGQMGKVVTVTAEGRVKVEPEVAAVGEVVTVTAAVDPAAARKESGGLVLQAVPGEGEAVSVEMRDPHGDGNYTGQCKLTQPGRYRVVLPEGSGLRLAEGRVEVGFRLDQPVREAEMLYGGGWVMRGLLFWKPNLERVSLRDVVRLENKEAAECRWEARLLFPKREHESERIAQKKGLDNVETQPFDGQMHLDTHLVPQSTTGTRQDVPGGFKGVLKNGQVLELGAESSLSEDALTQLFSNGQHQTLDRANGMVVELKLAWYDGSGAKVGERVVRVPLVVKTAHWAWQGAAAAAVYLVLAVVIGYFVRRWWKNRPRPAPEPGEPGEPERRDEGPLEEVREERPPGPPPGAFE
jgi:hypothetical protein